MNLLDLDFALPCSFCKWRMGIRCLPEYQMEIKMNNTCPIFDPGKVTEERVRRLMLAEWKS